MSRSPFGTQTSMNERRKTVKTYTVLFVICLISLSLRLWLLDKRWINPDEGAHLMDGVFALEGKIPAVDFNSRQPLYVYAIAGTLKLLGTNYISGRLMPLTCSILVGFLVFLMARLLFNEKVALLSAVIYWMLPLELINSVVVKTEPLVTLLICLSFYAVTVFSRTSKAGWLILTGVFGAAGFYVRQSALIVPLVVFGFLLLHKRHVREFAKCFAIFLVGYTAVFFLVLTYYSTYTNVESLLTGGLNPLGFLLSSGKRLLSILGISFEQSNGIACQTQGVSHGQYSVYYNYIRQAFYFHFFLLVGLAFSVLKVCRQFFSPNRLQIKNYVLSFSLVYLWLLSLLIAYTYFFYARGFFIDYFRELLPPLVIVFAASLYYSVPAFERDGILERFVVGGLFLSHIFFFIQSNYKPSIGSVQYASVGIALFTLFTFFRTFRSSTRRLFFASILLATVVLILVSRQAPLTPYFSGIVPSLAIIGSLFVVPWALSPKESRPSVERYVKFISLAVVLGAFVISLVHSANRLNVTYDSPWSPESLEKTSSWLMAHTEVNDTVMSGAVIWELQALRRPFMNISHPLSLAAEISEKEKQRIGSAILKQPPETIILDSNTEKTYFRQFPWLTDFLYSNYKLVHTAGPAKYPVGVYKLDPDSKKNTSYSSEANHDDSCYQYI